MSTEQLRIAMLSVHSCPIGNLGARDTGGMSVYLRELTRELGKQGHSLDIYTRLHGSQEDEIIELSPNVRLIHLRAGENEEVDKLAVFTYLSDFACSLESFRKHHHLQYDLVFSHYWLSGGAGKYLQQWWAVPHIIMFHTLGAIKNAIGIGEDEPELRIEVERELAQDCHQIIVATKREREELIRLYGASPQKISIVPCGVNLERFQPTNKETAKQRLGFGDSKVILFVGRIEPLKGIDQLIKAVSYLPNRQKPRLVIIGGDEHSHEEMERLCRLSRALHSESSVTFLGSVNHEQMPLFYSAADLCVLPSYYESFGLVALESLACNTPVIATDVGDLKNIIRQGETGYVLTDNSPHHLADKIAWFLSRPSSDAELTSSTRASVTRFSWVNIAEAITKECRLVLTRYLTQVA